MDAVNRVIAGIKDLGAASSSNVEQALANIDGIKSSILLTTAVNEFMRNISNTSAPQSAFAIHDKLSSNNDRTVLLNLIQEKLPKSEISEMLGNKTELEKWYKANSGSLSYDDKYQRYCKRNAGGLKCD